MSYWLIIFILCAGQVICYICYRRILLSIKKRYRAIDTHLDNLNQWVISSHQLLLQQVEQLHQQVNNLQEVKKLPERTTGKNEAAGIQVTQEELEIYLRKEKWINISERLPVKDNPELMQPENMQVYYASILNALQQLNKQLINQNPAPKIPANGHFLGNTQKSTGHDS